MKVQSEILFVVAMAAAFGLIGYTLLGPGGKNKQAQIRSELEHLIEENQALREKSRKLNLEVEALKHRNDYLEKIARDELGLIRKDEVIFDFKKAKAEAKSNSSETKSQENR